jgi:pimeloyl-ACP methyl ester carboxylesterase
MVRFGWLPSDLLHAFETDGSRVKLETWTQGDGPRTAALIHGASMGGDVWRDLGRILVDEYDLKLLLLDQRGHGRSPRSRDYRVSDFAGDLVDTLPAGLDFLIGQSLGGVASAWAAAAVKPGRYIGLDPAFTASAGAALMLRYLGPLQPKMPDWMLHRLGSPVKGSAPDTLERFHAMWSQWDPSMMKQLVTSGRATPFPVGPPAVPSTIVLADPSFVISKQMADEFRAAGWDVRLKPGGEHDLHLQDPQGIATLLDDVLRA